MSSIEKLWETIALAPGAAGSFRRFDESHPLDLYAGIDLEGRRVLMLVTEHPPAELPVAGIIDLSLNVREDGKFTLMFRLARPEFYELFGRLCQDLVEDSRDSNASNGAWLLLLRLGRWRKLLEAGPKHILSDGQVRGLFGELWFLKTVAIPRFGKAAAVDGWGGPLGKAQDFQLGDGLAEIKTILPGAHKVSISSADQLDSRGSPLELAVITIDASKGVSLTRLVTDLRLELEDLPPASAEFDLRLAESGYTERPEYNHPEFTVLSVRYYSVVSPFPRIITSALPAGVSRITYDLDLLDCEPYRSDRTYAAR
jgi:Putative  PD-(D/E)XK family member, (DUF4420)